MSQIIQTAQTAQPKEAKESRSIEFVPFGADQAIKLSIAIIRSQIAVPTRSGKLPDDRDCIKFMMLCQARHLNPFEGDAYLLGYDSNDGPTFSLITAHQVFLKRAEANSQFEGMESGVIVEGQPIEEGVTPMIVEREGDFMHKGETLLGGWARVFRKDRVKPFFRRLNLSVFTTGRSRWAKDPAGMIVKVAEADALRSAFPSHLGGLYSAEEGIKMVHEAPQERLPIFTQPKQLKVTPVVPEPASSGSVDAQAAEPESEPQPEQSSSTAQDAAPGETLLQTLERLCSEFEVEETAVVAHLVKTGVVIPGKTRFTDLGDKKRTAIIAHFGKTVKEMQEGGGE